ncbi:MAG: rRNA maturation RNase YbeY [Candidatus Onthovivens sp.]|nr:rRNA maturation RNase YbeY [Candidatus Onthovivens sp.]
MELSIYNETNEDLSHLNDAYNELLSKSLSTVGFDENVIMSVTFVNKDFIHKINKDYRNIDRPTDVISFAFLDDPKERQIKSDNPIDIGEIYICVEVAYENADIYGNSHDRELKFLFVHGVLHLLGYDHMEKEDEKIMFALQDKILGDK